MSEISNWDKILKKPCLGKFFSKPFNERERCSRKCPYFRECLHYAVKEVVESYREREEDEEGNSLEQKKIWSMI